MTRKPIALFDMDGSLADFDHRMREELLKIKSDYEPDPGYIFWHGLPKHIFPRMELIWSQPGWWLSLPPIEMGINAFNYAEEKGFECHIVTKGPRGCTIAWKEKVEWCQRYLGHSVPIHITSNKGMIRGDILYDDYPKFVLEWLTATPEGVALVPLSEVSKDFEHNKVIKISKGDWNIVTATFDRIRNNFKE